MIRLTVSEAVVLDRFLFRFSETDQLSIEDPSEEKALWNLQCTFEKIGDPDWPSLEHARKVLRGELD